MNLMNTKRKQTDYTFASSSYNADLQLITEQQQGNSVNFMGIKVKFIENGRSETH